MAGKKLQLHLIPKYINPLKSKNMNKLLKTLAIINGVLIPLAIIIVLYHHYKNNTASDPANEPSSLIVGKSFEKAKNDSIQLQGLHYDGLETIYNSSNYYLPVSVLTYEEAKSYKAALEMAGDMNPTLPCVVNLIFLDKNFNVLGQLVTKKAAISEIEMHHYDYDSKEVDKTALYIAYRISFEDTNGDGLLESNDNSDIYISDLNGKNLTQVTYNIDVNSFYFIDSNSKIFIKYTERVNIPDEYKRLKFGIFDISNSHWSELSALDSKLDSLEKALVK